MKKYTHPKLQNTTIILNNGSTYNKKWLVFKKFVKIDTNFNNYWLSIKKKSIKKK